MALLVEVLAAILAEALVRQLELVACMAQALAEPVRLVQELVLVVSALRLEQALIRESAWLVAVLVVLARRGVAQGPAVVLGPEPERLAAQLARRLQEQELPRPLGRPGPRVQHE